MARKRETKKPAGADDLEVLHPERVGIVAGRPVMVREYGFVEGLRLQPLTEPIVASLQSVIGNGIPPLEAILAILGEHADAVARLIAIAADVEEDWVGGLNQDDGHQLLMMWWGANGPFWLRLAFLRKAAQVCAGAISTPPSSAPATETPPPSAG